MGTIDISVKFEITLSKILAYLIVGIGTWYSIINKDASTLISSWGAASAIILNKQYQDRRKEIARIEYGPEGIEMETESEHEIMVDEKP
jgi:hypothetical protein